MNEKKKAHKANKPQQLSTRNYHLTGDRWAKSPDTFQPTMTDQLVQNALAVSQEGGDKKFNKKMQNARKHLRDK